MAWTAPFTAVAGSIFQASQFNTYVRDNLNETAPAKATTPGSIFAVSATNQIAERTPAEAFDTATVDITTTAFGNPATGSPGPSVTVNTGVSALVGYRALLRIESTTARVEMSYAISGATTRTASTTRSLGYSVSNSGAAGSTGLNLRGGVTDLAVGLTPGLNTFTLQYNVSSGTGQAADRRLWVLPL
jgi:hypothetical protein